MRALRFACAALAACLLSVQAAAAQEPPAQAPGAAPAAVTISITAGGVRVAALGPVGRTRLEVFGPTGEPVLYTGFQAGDVREWATRGAALPDGR